MYGKRKKLKAFFHDMNESYEIYFALLLHATGQELQFDNLAKETDFVECD